MSCGGSVERERKLTNQTEFWREPKEKRERTQNEAPLQPKKATWATVSSDEDRRVEKGGGEERERKGGGERKKKKKKENTTTATTKVESSGL